jgi:hypothetical protein
MKEYYLATIPSELGQIFYGKHRANILSKSLKPEMPEYPRGQIFLREKQGKYSINRYH